MALRLLTTPAQPWSKLPWSYRSGVGALVCHNGSLRAILSFTRVLLQTDAVTIFITVEPAIESRFAEYGPFVRSLRTLADRAVRGVHDSADVASVLDGAASRALMSLVRRSVRRDAGAYFTSSMWRRQIAQLLPPQPDGVWLDPACGAGDLLLCIAERLPIQPSLRDTVKDWGARLHGTDLEEEFVEAARMRLLVCAASRFRENYPDAPIEKIDKKKVFPHVRVEDGLEALSRKERPEGIIMNPPFVTQKAPSGTDWGSGGVSAAAVFLDVALSHNPGSKVLALLPDVLRTGTRYARLRHYIERRLVSGRVAATGIFGPEADIDVFVLAAQTAESPSSLKVVWWPQPPPDTRPLSDLADVAVGAVVDNRDHHVGVDRPYLTARELGRQQTVTSISRRRASDKTAETSPFIVLRRTSRPEVSGRPLAPALVVMDEPVAVDNHLIVIRPHDGSEAGCRRIIAALTSADVSRWIDERIRCRHLTTRAVSEIPISSLT